MLDYSLLMLIEVRLEKRNFLVKIHFLVKSPPMLIIIK